MRRIRIITSMAIRLPRPCGGCWWVLLGLVLAGCAEFRPTASEQTKSLSDLGDPKINASLPIPERGINVIRGRAIDVQSFLRIVSVGIVASDDQEALARMESFLGRKIQGGPADLPKGSLPQLACGVPVSTDGYVVTVAHVARRRHVIVLPVALAGDSFTPALGGPARVVFSDETADFALIKCEFATPRCLHSAPAAPSIGDVVFSGGWWKRSAGGKVESVSALRTSSGHSYRRFRSTVPMVPEEMGAPVVDDDGRLLGVMTRSRRGWFRRTTPHAYAVMLDPAELRHLIEADRANRR